MSLKLTRTERSAFFSGTWPRLTGPDVCPVAIGYVHPLSSRLSFEVIRVRTPKSGGWSIGPEDYVIRDHRDEPLLLPAGHRIPMDEKGDPPFTEESDAARGYGGNPRQALDAGRRVPADYQEELSKNSHSQWKVYVSAERSEEVQEQEMRAMFNTVRRLQSEALKKGTDLRPVLTDFIASAKGRLRNG